VPGETAVEMLAIQSKSRPLALESAT
jgi:hypothetical protein